MKPTSKPKQSSQGAQRAPASVADIAYTGIIDMILLRQLRPGERTSVIQLAERLQLGRTPVKEAITRLEAEGVLSVAERSGTTVNSISPQAAAQVFAMRRNLESFGVDDAVRHVTPADIRLLKDLLAEMSGSLAASERSALDAARFVKANVRFHAGIVAAAHNPLLDRLYAQIQLQAQIVTYLFHAGVSSGSVRPRQKEHAAILKALESRDAPLLKRLLAEHARTTEQSVLKAVTLSQVQVKPVLDRPASDAAAAGRGPADAAGKSKVRRLGNGDRMRAPVQA